MHPTLVKEMKENMEKEDQDLENGDQMEDVEEEKNDDKDIDYDLDNDDENA